MSADRPVADPDITTQPWWDATRSQKLLVQRCDDCGYHQHYPRSVCTSCASARVAFVEASGRGTVYSFTEVHRAPHPFFTPPYVVALVRLEEGPVLLTNVIGEVACDMPCAVHWQALDDGRQLPVFRRA